MCKWRPGGYCGEFEKIREKWPAGHSGAAVICGATGNLTTKKPGRMHRYGIGLK